MCGIPCLSSKWTPSLTPEYRPPRLAGWTIREMPGIFPEPLRAAWRVRQKVLNRNGQDAVLEMANFAKINGAEITREEIAEIRAQADREWCEAEPSRCPRSVKLGTASTPRPPTAAEAPAKARPRTVAFQAPAAKSVQRRGCCGGRVR